MPVDQLIPRIPPWMGLGSHLVVNKSALFPTFLLFFRFRLLKAELLHSLLKLSTLQARPLIASPPPGGLMPLPSREAAAPFGLRSIVVFRTPAWVFGSSSGLCSCLLLSHKVRKTKTCDDSLQLGAESIARFPVTHPPE